MRVLPLENEDVNECWIADRDRFSYEALNSEERLTRPMLKQGGVWKEVDWQTALEYVANGVQGIKSEHGAASIGALLSPHSTLEELYLARNLLHGLGSSNIDYRLRNAEFVEAAGVRWLGRSIASLTTLESALVIGSNLRKDHPLFAQRIRQATRQPAEWVQTLANVAASVAQEKDVDAPVNAGTVNDNTLAVARTLLKGEHKAILLGNAAAHHAQADALLSLAQWIGEQTGATVGYLTEAANTVGAQWVQAVPSQGGQNATEMLTGGLKCVVLLNTEPEWDSAAGAQAATALGKAEMVVTCSPFKANMEFSDVLLPIAPFTETSGSFVNAEGRLQSFHAVVKPRGETRPGWKVLRVLANLLGVEGFDFETSQDVLAQATGAAAGSLAFVPDSLLSNAAVATSFTALNALSDASVQNHDPVVASIYQLDGIVRRAVSLQLTADARRASAQGAQA